MRYKTLTNAHSAPAADNNQLIVPFRRNTGRRNTISSTKPDFSACQLGLFSERGEVTRCQSAFVAGRCSPWRRCCNVAQHTAGANTVSLHPGQALKTQVKLKKWVTPDSTHTQSSPLFSCSTRTQSLKPLGNLKTIQIVMDFTATAKICCTIEYFKIV